MFIHTSLLLLAILFAVSLACNYDGTEYQDGDEWTVSDNFVMRCTITTNGANTRKAMAIVACLGPWPQRTKIPVGEERTEGPYTYQCTSQNGEIRMRQELNRNAPCGTHSAGDIWVEGNFEYRCEPGGQKDLTACIAAQGTRVPLNSVLRISGVQWECRHHPNNGTVSLRQISDNIQEQQNMNCIDADGSTHSFGSSWTRDTHFNKTCTAGGRVKIANCLTRDGRRVPINGELTVNGQRYVCEKRADDSIFFRTVSVGGSSL